MNVDLELNRVINMLTAHPDNEPNSEFSDKIDSLISVKEFLKEKMISFDDYIKREGYKQDFFYFKKGKNYLKPTEIYKEYKLYLSSL